jgi:hypothetical protein
MVDEDELHLVGVPAQALHDAVDAVAGQPEHGVDAPLGQSIDQYFGSNLSHDLWLPVPPDPNRCNGQLLAVPPDVPSGSVVGFALLEQD